MRWFAILAGCMLFAATAQADDAPVPTCNLVSSFIVSQNQGTVTISCTGVTEGYGDQLVDLLTRVLQNKLDPQSVIAKLDEIERVPDEGKPRTIDETQRQAIIQVLLNKPPQEIAIVAHSAVEDSADYGKQIATALLMVGWQIEGRQIKRAAPPQFDELRGVALLVHDKTKPPEKAVLLRAALTAAHVVAPILADPTLAADATVLWVGRRPAYMNEAEKP